MLDEKTRSAIRTLANKKISQRKIAKLLKISRNSVRDVLDSHSSQPKTLTRPTKADPHRDRILELHQRCQGNLVRVHEELEAEGVEIAYPTLTAFLPPPRDRNQAQEAGRQVSLRAGPGDAA